MTVELATTIQRWRGLSTDTKPAAPPIGSAFRETDTHLDFVYTGAGWVFAGGEIHFADAVALGRIPNVFADNKFGRNVEINSGATADIWDGGQATGGVALIWVAPTAAAKHNIKSSSASDAAAGVGARTVRVVGLLDWDTAETNENVTLDGTTDVETTNAYVIIHRMYVLTKGATGVNVGVITATAKAPSATTVTAEILAGQGQTQMAIYGFPSTQTVLVGRQYANANKAGGAAGLADVHLCFNAEPQNEIINFIVRHRFGLQTVGTSAFTIPYDYVPKRFDGPGILKLQAISGSNGMDVSAGFDVRLYPRAA